jgi:hypothetical protein
MLSKPGEEQTDKHVAAADVSENQHTPNLDVRGRLNNS